MSNNGTSGGEHRIDDAQGFVRPAEVLVREVGDELVVLNTASEQYHSLNSVGRRCYELLASGHGVDATVSVICTEYDVAPDRAHADLVDLVAELLESGLLRASA